MLAGWLYAAALPVEIVGLFAVWNWSRRSTPPGWLLGGVGMLALMAGALCAVPNPFSDRFYVAFVGIYLFSRLTWAWWFEDRHPAVWKLGEISRAMLAAAIFSFANSGLR